MSESVLLLPGDHVGPEVIDATVAVLDELGDFDYKQGLIGGEAMDAHDGDPFPPETEEQVKEAGAILLGAVGGPEWESTEPDAPRPEHGLLELRQAVGAHANLRPIFSLDSLPGISPLPAEHIRGVEMLIVRELLGGSYFGESDREGDTAHDDREYSRAQIEAVARTAFDLALDRAVGSGRGAHVTSVDKANVLETSRLWREVVTELHLAEYEDVELDHMYVDNAALQVNLDPRHFDVILAENEHGDILSDAAALIPGSLGILPSASVDSNNRGIFEPVHGSAPDIAGRGTANPVAAFLSAAMMLDTMGMRNEAGSIRWAVDGAFKRGVMTPDLKGGQATTQEFTDRVRRDLQGYAGRQ